MTFDHINTTKDFCLLRTLKGKKKNLFILILPFLFYHLPTFLTYLAILLNMQIHIYMNYTHTYLCTISICINIHIDMLTPTCISMITPEYMNPKTKELTVSHLFTKIFSINIFF